MTIQNARVFLALCCYFSRSLLLKNKAELRWSLQSLWLEIWVSWTNRNTQIECYWTKILCTKGTKWPFFCFSSLEHNILKKSKYFLKSRYGINNWTFLILMDFVLVSLMCFLSRLSLQSFLLLIFLFPKNYSDLLHCYR